MVDVKLNPEVVKKVSVVGRAVPLFVVWAYWFIVCVGGLVTVLWPGIGDYEFKEWISDLGKASIALAIVYAARDIGKKP